MPDQELIAETEEWFEQRGLPHFVEGHRASEDVYTRVAPLLVLVFVLEVLGAANLEWVWWQNLVAIVAGAGMIVLAWVVMNKVRRRRPLALPESVGRAELAAFILMPAALPIVFDTQWVSALITFAVNVVIVLTASFLVSFGVPSIVRWGFWQTYRQVGQVVDLFARALPLLLLFTVALFINAEVWQVGASLNGFLFWSALGFFFLVAAMFLLIRLPRELGVLRQQLRGDRAVAACQGTPLADVAPELARDLPPAPMSGRQEKNVLLVLLFSQAVQVVLVASSIVLFFVLFGVIAIRPDVASSWTGSDIGAGELLQWTWFGQELSITSALLRVAMFLGALSGLYFTVYVITDNTYRDEFFEDVLHEVRESIAVRNVYLALRARHG